MQKFWVSIVAGIVLCSPLQGGYREIKLMAANGAASDYYGYSVALSNETAVVGSYRAAAGGLSHSGSAYIYTRNGSSWTETQLPRTGQAIPVAEQGFGFSVAINGDTLAVGAPGYEISGNNNAVYIYTRSGLTWTLQQKLTGTSGYGFGYSVDIDGDRLVVGATKADNNHGAVYVYTRSGTTWSLSATLTAPALSNDPDPSHGWGFGRAIAIEGTTIVVGAAAYSYGGGSGNLWRGAAWVWAYNGSNWSIQKDLTSLVTSELSDGDHFGASVDINNGTVVIGAVCDGNVNEGAAYVFLKGSSTWSRQARLIAANRSSGGSSFGTSVFVLGDRALIGSIDSVSGVSYCGAVHEFIRQGATWTEQSRLIIPQNSNDMEFLDYYGHSVAVSGEYMIIGAFSDNQTASDAGAAYIYMNCTYTLAGDLNTDCRVDMEDIKLFASAWLSSYTLYDFSDLSASWQIDCFDTPTNAACN